MTTKQLFAIKMQLNEKFTANSQALTDYCKPFKGLMGLVSDECRNSDTYKKLKAQSNYDWQTLRAFNGLHYKNKELIQATRDDIMARRLSKVGQ